MIELLLQQFGGRGSSSGGSGGGGGINGVGNGFNALNKTNSKSNRNADESVSHEDIEDMFNLLQSVDMGYQANAMISTWRSLYEKIHKGEPFVPDKEEGALLNGFIVNYGSTHVHYLQTYGLNSATVSNSREASSLFRQWAKERFDNGDEFSYTNTARQIQQEEKTKSKRTRKK